MRKPLTFNVGPYVYRLFYVDDLRDPRDGAKLWGWIDGERYEILIDASASRLRRFDVLVHELSHAWDFAVGEPKDAESRCDRSAVILRSLSLDVDRQSDRADDLRELGADTLRPALPTVNAGARDADLTEWFAGAGRTVAHG